MDQYVVKLWDRCDKKWYKVGGPFNKQQAQNHWEGRTCDGTVNARPVHGDYFKIFKLPPKITITKLK